MPCHFLPLFIQFICALPQAQSSWLHFSPARHYHVCSLLQAWGREVLPHPTLLISVCWSERAAPRKAIWLSRRRPQACRSVTTPWLAQLKFWDCVTNQWKNCSTVGDWRDFRLPRAVYGNCALLGYYAASSGNSLPTFRYNLSVRHRWCISCWDVSFVSIWHVVFIDFCGVYRLIDLLPHVAYQSLWPIVCIDCCSISCLPIVMSVPFLYVHAVY